MFTVVVIFLISEVLTNCVLEPDYMFGGGGIEGVGGLVKYYYFFLPFFLGGGGQREGNGGHIWQKKKPKMALISDYLAAASSPDASADALAIINIG